MTKQTDVLLSRLGFRFSSGGPHASRTMMLDDLRVLLKHVPSGSERAVYADAVIQGNVLGKPTRKTRELAWKYLLTLYSFEAGKQCSQRSPARSARWLGQLRSGLQTPPQRRC